MLVPLHVPAVVEIEPTVTPAGSVSVTEAHVAASGPALRTKSV